jgi:hypothetical protein
MLERAVRAYFVANVVLLVALGVTLPFQEPGTGPYVITVLALAVVVPGVLGAGAVLYFAVDLPRIG